MARFSKYAREECGGGTYRKAIRVRVVLGGCVGAGDWSHGRVLLAGRPELPKKMSILVIPTFTPETLQMRIL